MDLQQIWQEFQSYDGEGSRQFELPECRVQFYKGAMEIPLIAFYPNYPFSLEEASLAQFSRLLSAIGCELDCVEEGGNYKINRRADRMYLGRVTADALKLHAARIRELGWEVFRQIVGFQLERVVAQSKR